MMGLVPSEETTEPSFTVSLSPPLSPSRTSPLPNEAIVRRQPSASH